MQTLSLAHFLRLRRLVYRDARPLDFAKWKYLFEGGSCEDYLSVLASYQNEDGGFGHNLECNCWNPHSSPYTICIALDYLDVADEESCPARTAIEEGILRYLASGAFAVEGGWVGMQGVPSNNDYAHMPWFHYDEKCAREADVGVTKRLVAFIEKVADKDSALYQKAAMLKEKHKDNHQILLRGVPYDAASLPMADFDPASWPFWIPQPIYYLGSPRHEAYQALKATADKNLDVVVAGLEKLEAITFTSEEDLIAYEKNNPHPEGKKWCVAEQTVGNYYWGTYNIVYDMDILRKFDRLDFALPVRGA